MIFGGLEYSGSLSQLLSIQSGDSKLILATAPPIYVEMEKPRLCEIYLRDVISLLPREDIEKLQRSSKRLCTTVANYPTGKLPRVLFHSLTMTFLPLVPEAQRFIAYWNSNLLSSGCCRELRVSDFPPQRIRNNRHINYRGSSPFQEFVKELVGELVDTRSGKQAMARFFLLKGPLRGVRLEMVNQLGEWTAFQLLHFLHHVHGAAFSHHAYIRGLNDRIIVALNKGRARMGAAGGPFRLHYNKTC